MTAPTPPTDAVDAVDAVVCSDASDCSRAIVAGVVDMQVDVRLGRVVGAAGWLNPLCRLVGSPGAVVSLFDAAGTVVAVASTMRRPDLDVGLVGSRARSLVEWAPLLDGTCAWTEVDHSRAGRAFRSTAVDLGANGVVHAAALNGDGRVVAIVSVLAPLATGRSSDVVPRTVETAQLLGWALSGTEREFTPVRVADLQSDPREIVAAMADALETLAPPVVQLTGLGRPAVANGAAVGLFDGVPADPRRIIDHPLVGRDLLAGAVFGGGATAHRGAADGATRLQVVRSLRGDRIEGVVIVLPRQMSAAPGPAVDVRRPLPVPRSWELSRREHEVVTLLLDGQRVPAIAARLYVSADTVRGHLKRVFRKVGVTSQVELIVQARALAQRP